MAAWRNFIVWISKYDLVHFNPKADEFRMFFLTFHHI